MSAVGAVLVESTRHRCVLAVACNDLLLDARVIDGLELVAWPLAGGPPTRALQTASGAYAFHGLPGMRAAELPREGGPPVEARTFVVEVVDRRRRFVDTVLTVSVPHDGLVGQSDVLGDAGDGSVADLPVHLFSAPQRPLPTHVTAVRASVADHGTGAAVPWCRVTVTVDPDGLARRVSGVADARGEVVVVVPSPRVAPPDEPPGEDDGDGGGTDASDGAIVDGLAVTRSWPVTVQVHHEAALLAWPSEPSSRLRPGAPLPPALDRVLAQGPGQLWTSLDDPPGPALPAELHQGVDLVLHTLGDPGSRLLIEGASA